MSRSIAPLVLLTLLAVAPRGAHAQSRADVPAPGQAVTTDGRLGHWWLSLRSDAVSPFFGAWGGTVDVAPCPWVSVGLTPAYVSRDAGTGFSVDATLRVWPLGHGLEGFFVGAVVGVLRTSANDVTTLALDIGGDAGWQIVWGGVSVTLSAGGAWMAAVDGPADGIEGPVARLRVELGWTWR